MPAGASLKLNNNTITSDMITRRLGGTAQRSVYEADEPVGVAEAADSRGSSAGFMVLMFMLFLVVGGGTYFIAGVDITMYEIKLTLRQWHIIQ